MSSISSVIFGASAYPRKIEDDPMFNAWNRWLPRLWYLDQRQATRLDAESLYGASRYAILYSRAEFEDALPAVIESAVVIRTGFGYTQSTVLPEVTESVSRLLSLSRTAVTALPAVTETGFVSALRPVNVVLSASLVPTTLHLHYEHPGGSVTYYEIETATAAIGPWTAFGTTTSNDVDWVTESPGYMRVRSVSGGGPSSWVQVGPVTPLPDLPTNVIATYVSSGTKVLVGWGTPALNAAVSWTVRRVLDGAVIASDIPLGTLTATDDSPLQGTTTYTVEAVNGAGVTSRVASAPLTINLQPATATGSYQAVNSALVSWNPSAQGQPDQWRVYNVTTSTWASAALAGTTTSYVVSGLTPGTAYTFSVYPFLAGVQGTGRATGPVLVPASDPISVALNTNGYGGGLRLTWAYPGGGVTNYELQTYVAATGPWTTWKNSTTGSEVWATSAAGYARVRSLSDGGPSNWVQVGPVTPLPAYPAVPNTPWVTAWDYSNITVAWSAGAGGAPTTSYVLERLDSVGNTTWGPYNVGTATSYSLPVNWDTSYQFRVYAVSAAGLTSGWSGVVRPHIGHPYQETWGWVPRTRYWESHSQGAFGRDEWCAVVVPSLVVLNAIHWRNMYTPQSGSITSGTRDVDFIMNNTDVGSFGLANPTNYDVAAPFYGNWGTGALYGLTPVGSGWSAVGNSFYQLWVDDMWLDGTEHYQNYELVSTVAAVGNSYW